MFFKNFFFLNKVCNVGFVFLDSESIFKKIILNKIKIFIINIIYILLYRYNKITNFKYILQYYFNRLLKINYNKYIFYL
ncbi:hypothetical protein AB836_02085 [Rickettsiales bacterium (ex Bugula neritina AB1)]|nr:hypothetical protein AB836_02085 [Rickettsiales bacterium (ex Bugula neritina AB1)]